MSGWDPHNPTGTYLFIKRALDPLGCAAYLLAACAFRATDDALVSALERPPFPLRLVASVQKLRRPIILTYMSLIAATAVVSLR